MKSCTALNLSVLLILAIHLWYASADDRKSASSASVRHTKPVPVNMTGADAYCSSNEQCSKSSPCCKKEGEIEGTCCDQESMSCCGESIGCATTCESQFDAVPCEKETAEKLLTFPDVDCPNMLETNKLYRTTRPDQDCKTGLKAKNAQGTRSPSSHVGCGSRNGYTSQYISFSTSLDVMFDKYYPTASTGSRIVRVMLDWVPEDCDIYDLTVPTNRDKWLSKKNSTAKNYAARDCEVLLDCKSPVPCKTIYGPKKDEAKELQDNPPHRSEEL